jgi:membrane protein
VPGGQFVDAMAILKVLYSGSKISGTTLVASPAIRAHTRIGYDEMRTLLEQMVTAGWVGRVQTDISARARWGKGARENIDQWVLLLDPNVLRLSDVYRLFVFGAAGLEALAISGPEPVAVSPVTLDTATLARQVEEAVERGLDQTLAEHFGDRRKAE